VVLGLVDECLWMFHAHAKGKRLGLNFDTYSVQEGKDVACGVPCGEYHAVGFFPKCPVESEALDAAGVEFQVVQMMFKMDFATAAYYELADVFYNFR
jgi:hypothetical protein